MRKQCYDKDLEDIYVLFDGYFVLSKAMRDMANEIPDLDSREEKVKAYKEYFRKPKRLKELKVNVEDHLKIQVGFGLSSLLCYNSNEHKSKLGG